MDWYTSCNRKGLDANGECLIVAVHSCLKNTTLVPHIIYYDAPNSLMNYFMDIGVDVQFQKNDLEIKIRSTQSSKEINIEWLIGSSTRFHVPTIIENTEYVLYTDTDVMFNEEIALHPQNMVLAAAKEILIDKNGYREYDNIFNAGVMVMNVKFMRSLYQTFEAQCLLIASGEVIEPWYDQGILNKLLKNIWTTLPQTLNSRPYFSSGTHSAITHFQFVKPSMINSNGTLKTKGSPEVDIFSEHKDKYFELSSIYQKYLYPNAVQALLECCPDALLSV